MCIRDRAVDPQAIELSFWDTIKDSKQSADYQDYLAKYPNGQFAPLASRRVAALSQTVSRSSDAVPASASAPSAPSAVAAEPTQVAMGSAPPPAAAAPSASSGPSMASKIEEQGKICLLYTSRCV